MHRPLIGLLCAVCCAGTASAGIVTLTSSMFGFNETPPTGSPATGSSVVTVDTTAQTLAVIVNFSGLIGGPAAAAHIHCCAPVGIAAIVAVPFTSFPSTTSGSYTNLFDLTLLATYNGAFVTANGGTAASAETALINGMLAGMTYTNIHDGTFPSGEIRGQLAAVPEPTTLFLGAAGLLLLLAARRAMPALR